MATPSSSNRDAATQCETGDPDLLEAASIFLRGPVSSGGTNAAPGDMGGQAVAHVARKLSLCSPASIREIKRALLHFRHEPNFWARDAVIEAVTGAAAHLPAMTKENS